MSSTNNLLAAIIEGVQSVKGENLIDMDLSNLDQAACDHFVICHGNSDTQVEAIAHSIEKKVNEITGEKVIHADGYRNAEWILLDFVDVMVHVFQKEVRERYDLESLWADAKIKNIN